jgi:hypothetical protein
MFKFEIYVIYNNNSMKQTEIGTRVQFTGLRICSNFFYFQLKQGYLICVLKAWGFLSSNLATRASRIFLNR